MIFYRATSNGFRVERGDLWIVTLAALQEQRFHLYSHHLYSHQIVILSIHFVSSNTHDSSGTRALIASQFKYIRVFKETMHLVGAWHDNASKSYGDSITSTAPRP